MTIEELLKPRFKLRNDYPGNTQPVGTITKEIATAEYFRKYPANFNELNWWEEREEKDMPDYIRNNATDAFLKGRIYKHKRILMLSHEFIFSDGSFLKFKDAFPATKEEHESQNK